MSQQGRPLLLSLDHCNHLLHMLGRNHACVFEPRSSATQGVPCVPWPCLFPDVGIPLVAFQASGLGFRFPRGDPTGLAVESGWTRGGLETSLMDETTFCFLNERAPMGAKGAPVQPLFSQKITTSPLPLANEFGWFSCRPRTKPQVAYCGWTKSTPIGTG